MTPNLVIHLVAVTGYPTGQVPHARLEDRRNSAELQDDPSVAANYRPVSLTSICCMILEHVIFSHVMSHYTALTTSYVIVGTDFALGAPVNRSLSSLLMISPNH